MILFVEAVALFVYIFEADVLFVLFVKKQKQILLVAILKKKKRKKNVWLNTSRMQIAYKAHRYLSKYCPLVCHLYFCSYDSNKYRSKQSHMFPFRSVFTVESLFFVNRQTHALKCLGLTVWATIFYFIIFWKKIQYPCQPNMLLTSYLFL